MMRITKFNFGFQTKRYMKWLTAVGICMSILFSMSMLCFASEVKSINHRGYNTVAPENTLPAYELSKGERVEFRREGDRVKVPVKFIGVGEGIDDLQRFDPEAFVSAIFEM